VLAGGIPNRGGRLGFLVTLLENPRLRTSDQLRLRLFIGFVATSL